MAEASDPPQSRDLDVMVQSAHPGTSHRLHRGLSFGLLVVFLMSISIRIALFTDFPIFLVNDSGAYLSISEGIYRDWNMFSPGLGDWRLPVYPIFLSLLRFGSRFDSGSIVLFQKIVGTSCILLGLAIGYLLRSRLLAAALVLFLGMNPVYLLNEHLVMAEGLFLFSLLAFSAMALICLHGKASMIKGIVLGFAFGLCILTRANGLFFCGPILVGVILVRSVAQGSPSSPRTLRLSILRLVVGISAGASLLLGPWLWRNYAAFGKIVPFTYNSNINMFVYLSQHDLLDTSLPEVSKFRDIYNPDQPHTIYDIVWLLRQDIAEGEALAKTMVREQVADHPLKYGREMLYALLHFPGFPAPGVGYGRSDVYGWFQNMVSDLDKVYSSNISMGWCAAPAYIASRADSLLTRLWSETGMAYLSGFRIILFITFSLLMIKYLWQHRKDRLSVRHVSVVLFSLAYLSTAIGHSLTLSDYDRFATPFDWILFMVVTLVCNEYWKQRKMASSST